MSSRPLIIVDAMNLFIRSYAAYPTMSSHGYQMGGTIGFLKTLRRIVGEVQPRAIYIAWEGGGSTRRRRIFSEYKMNRRPSKLNRFYEDDIPDSDENEKHQIFQLLAMLKCIPVCQLYAADCEADDVIAHLCCGPFKSDDKVIVSSDKDLYQLIDENTRQYSLHKKTYVTVENVLEEFRVTPANFGIAKTLCGDKGDNVPGIKGFGFKTVARLFPFLGTDDDILLQDVIDFSHTHVDESALYRRVVHQEADVRRNWKLVHLDGSMLSQSQVSRIKQALETYDPSMDRMGLMRLLIKEGIGDFDIAGFSTTFNCIEDLEYERNSE